MGGSGRVRGKGVKSVVYIYAPTNAKRLFGCSAIVFRHHEDHTPDYTVLVVVVSLVWLLR